MSEFIQEYVNMLILQYYHKDNAVSEIELRGQSREAIKDAIDEILNNFDIDLATTDALDKIGKLIGLSRVDPMMNDDEVYRFLLKLKIAKNTSSAVITNDEGNGLQDVIRFALGDSAFVVDKQTMALDLYVDDTVTIDLLELIFRLNLLPKPQAVRYNNIKQISDEPAFGFDNNPNSRAFADKFDPSFDLGGPFRDKIVLNF